MLDDARCWRSARERARRKARFAIRERVFPTHDRHHHHSSSSVTTTTAPEAVPASGTESNLLYHHVIISPPSSECGRAGVSTTFGDDRAFFRHVIRRIVDGDRSFFSVVQLQKQGMRLSSAFPTAWLWEEPEPHASDDNVAAATLIGAIKLTSWFGTTGVRDLEAYFRGLETCTVMEYASWIQRHHILMALVLGGINPGVRGTIAATRTSRAGEPWCSSRTRAMVDDIESTRAAQLARLSIDEDGQGRDEIMRDPYSLRPWGEKARQLFFSGVPLVLSGYVVRKVMNMRRKAWEETTRTVSSRHDHDVASVNHGAGTWTCAGCHSNVPVNLRLVFDAPCQHRLCERCFWRDVIHNLNERGSDDVVTCLACETTWSETRGLETTSQESPSEQAGASEERRRISLRKFQSLPKTGAELKRTNVKRNKVHEHDILQSSWPAAVQSSLGHTQEVRRDKFFHYLEQSSSTTTIDPFVRACLELGMDIELRNEYGQTGFFVAASKGLLPLVRLLLWYGSDYRVVTNGGFTARGAAQANGHWEVVQFLEMYHQQYGESKEDEKVAQSTRSAGSCVMDTAIANEKPTTLSILIDSSVCHPGAGSFAIDHALDDRFIKQLIAVWENLPIDDSVSKKMKAVECSERRYYCDSEKQLTSVLSSVIQREIGEAKVFEHMRFLNYASTGMVLAPHVDLCRFDSASKLRSTHTMLLYLTDCPKGGATSLLRSLYSDGCGDGNSLARVAPIKGRILLFPHNCPHEGEEVIDSPKLLIRGEVLLYQTLKKPI